MPDGTRTLRTSCQSNLIKIEPETRREGWRTRLLRRNWFMARFWDYCKKRRGLKRGWERGQDVKRKKLTISDLNLDKPRARDPWLDLRLLAIDQLLDPKSWFEYRICFQQFFSLKEIFWQSHILLWSFSEDDIAQ
jgi:hypothetical protein